MSRTREGMIERLHRLVLLGATLVVALLLPPLAQADSGQRLLKQARDAFEYGDYARAAQTLGGQATREQFPQEAERIEAYRLLGLSYFYLSKQKPSDPTLRENAQEAFFGLLKQNPDFEFDPFYTPPEAVAFFDSVRRENEPYLEPIRVRRNARLREQQLEEDARLEAERRRREESPRAEVRTVIVERELERPSFLVAMMPFGVGQFQNGDTRTGLGFLSGQLVSSALSIISWSLIELMRDPESNRYSAELYGYANTLQTIKYWSAGTFYALWVASAIHAGVRFEPLRVIGESTLAPPSAAPNGPLVPRPAPMPEPWPAESAAPSAGSTSTSEDASVDAADETSE